MWYDKKEYDVPYFCFCLFYTRLHIVRMLAMGQFHKLITIII